jgi:lipid-binding SYLF domain-containing protein
MIKILKPVWLLALAVLLMECTATGRSGDTPEERRQAIRDMRADVLEELFRVKPDVRPQVGEAVGYAVFSSANVNLILASFGGGIGVVRDNRDGQETFMRMGEVGIGIGAGIKDFRAVFIFHDEDSLDDFVDRGWVFGGQADAAAKANDLGAAVAGEAVLDNITVYQLTESGLALQATVKGTRYWRDSELN